MATPKINNVRVHVWTKSELNETAKQLKAGGFEIKKNAKYPGSFEAYDADYCMLSAIIGYPRAGYVTLRLDGAYFNYSDNN